MYLQEAAADILNRLRDRLTLRNEDLLNGIQFAPVILPITSIDGILKDTFGSELKAASDPGGTGDYLLWTCPTGYRYHLMVVNAFGSAGTITHSGIGFQKLAGTNRIWLYNYAANQYVYKMFEQPVIFDPGDTLYISISAYAAGNTISCRAYGMVEKIY